MACTWEVTVVLLPSFLTKTRKAQNIISFPTFSAIRFLSPTKTMAELLLSAFLQPLLDRLASHALQIFARQQGLQEQLEKWNKTLTTIQIVLDDVEEKQLNDKRVKVWLDDFRHLAYDLEFATEALRSKLKIESQGSTSMVRNLIPASLTPSAFQFKFRLGSNIEKINTTFNDLVTQKDQLNLNANVFWRPIKKRKILPPTSVMEDQIYGREDVAGALLQLLVSEKHIDHASNKVPKVIPIHGMGGIGKTTLAQLVYNHKEVENFFNLKAWACVSEDFDIATVTKTILQSVTSENCDGKDLNWLQVKLKEKLVGKRFLVILDDIWNENFTDWTLLRAPFEAGAPGSSIVITTRSQKVSSLMGTVKVEKPFQLELLSNDACLSIFSRHALDAKDFSGHLNLKDIGEEIVEKCKGLPLAVKTVGGLLRCTQAREEWEKVLKSKIWNIPQEESNIVPALMLSYHHLPSHLKRCFAYCSILPKDYEFEEKEVVLLWMAEGLIQPRQDEETLEDLGTEYFRSLLSRSLFQQSRNNETRFLMHDLINDLAQSVAGDTCFRIEDRVGGSLQRNIPFKARHISYLGSRYEVTEKFEVFSELTNLRTFLPLMQPFPGLCFLPHHVPFELIQALRCLRVLSFNGYCITKLSDSISNLKHLRYLDLSNTKITSLPESITTLYRLQTLLLKNCARLKKLPSMLQNLVNLRNLNIEGENCLKGMPMEVGKLTCLQTLSNFILGKDNCSGINELGPLKHLKGTLCISRLENVMKPEDANDAELIRKTKISALRLNWSANSDESKDSTRELEILDGLRPHDDLEEFVIIHYGGTKFPIWLTSHLFTRMVSLKIRNCEKCQLLPPFGQLPSLKFLWIENLASVKNIGPEFCGDHGTSQCFKSLKTLFFMNMKEWEYWSPCEEFPNLHELFLCDCPKLLGKLPNRLPLLEKVWIRRCEQLEVVSVSSLPDQCKICIDDNAGVVYGSNVMFESIFIGTNSKLSGRIEGFDADKWLSKLEYLNIFSVRVDEVEEGIFHPSMPSSTLKRIYIFDCRGLESLPKALMDNSTCLSFIEIQSCHSLTHLARGQLPPTLKKLFIDKCPSLKYLTSSGELPTTLQNLKISGCEELESVAKSFLHNSFLESISISHCEKMKAQPDDIHKLTSLRHLQIKNCPSISSFPTEGFPTNLTTLSISHSKFTEALFDWGLDNLTVLNELTIEGCQHLVSFPEMTLPASLTRLRISEFSNLECLSSKGLRKLTSLETLEIHDCKKFTSFSEDGLPPSLLELLIDHCEQLSSFPKNGLPPSLQQLEIRKCPLLEERCKKDQRGGEWRRIADIPCVEINYKFNWEDDTETEE